MELYKRSTYMASSIPCTDQMTDERKVGMGELSKF
jgi:hypothetical protein